MCFVNTAFSQHKRTMHQSELYMESCLSCLLAVDLKIHVDTVMLTHYSTLLGAECIREHAIGMLHLETVIHGATRTWL